VRELRTQRLDWILCVLKGGKSSTIDETGEIRKKGKRTDYVAISRKLER